MRVNYLKIAGAMSLFAAVMHLAIIAGGPSWYRFFGAGEAMASMAEQGLLQPTVITVSIALILASWSAYAWSAAGILPRFPFTKGVLILITLVYLLRGVFGLLAPFVSSHPQITQNSVSFWVWSSTICLAFGLIHLKGIRDEWFS